jgi:hypothetical protein
MAKEPSFEQVRANVEERQKAILWEDARKGGRSVDQFLWKGDPNAKPVQRVGLGVFGLTFLFLGFCLVSVSWEKDEWGGRIAGSLLGCAAILASIRLLRNAILRSARPDRGHKKG